MVNEDIYREKYLKYKKKYLELKYGGAIDISTIISPDMKKEFIGNITKYIDTFLEELLKNDNTKIKQYINDIKILYPLLKNIGGLFITNIEILDQAILPIININLKNITKNDIKKIKKQLEQIKIYIPQLEVKKSITPTSIVWKVPSLIKNFTKLKNTSLYNDLGLKNIFKPVFDKISSTPIIGSKIKKLIFD